MERARYKVTVGDIRERYAEWVSAAGVICTDGDAAEKLDGLSSDPELSAVLYWASEP